MSAASRALLAPVALAAGCGPAATPEPPPSEDAGGESAWAMPTGSSIAFTAHVDDQWDVFLWDPAGAGPPRRVTETGVDEFNPALAPHAAAVLYTDSAGGAWHHPLDGGERRPLDAPDARGLLLHLDVDPDGARAIAARRVDPRHDDTSLVVLPLGEQGDDRARRYAGAWSPFAELSGARRLDMTSTQFWPAWAPDGDRIAFTQLHSKWAGRIVAEVWEARTDVSWARQLVLTDGLCESPAWSPAGDQVAFACNAGGNWDLHVVDPLTRERRRLTTHDAADTDPTWSPDGGRLAFASTRSGISALWLLDPESGEATPLRPFADEGRPCAAPDWR